MFRFSVSLMLTVALAACGARTAPLVDAPPVVDASSGVDACLPSAELCNGVDDDCDGAVDEAPACGVDAGPDEPCTPEEETCNGVDDDCDGERDEGLAGCLPQLACGVYSTCALGSGALLCVGSYPDSLPGVTDATHLSVGRGVCVRRETGAVVCTRGIEGFAAVTDAVEVAVEDGLSHACARRRDGTVVCWGQNDHAQLGDGTTANAAVPVQVAGLRDAADLALGAIQTCARRRGGSVVCWGSIGPFPEGGGSAFDRLLPTPIVGLSDAVEIGAGRVHTCARRRGGTVVCWGENRAGQLGDGTQIRRPLAAAPVVGLTDAVELAIGADHSCARRSTGEVLCWGQNFFGQLGDGTTMQRLTPTPVVGFDMAVDVAAGFRHSCARRVSGAVFCWGNTAGFSPETPETASPLPTFVEGL
jgi:hypothetical protein